MSEMQKAIIPEQQLGSKTDIESKIEADTNEEARNLFKQAKSHLLNVNNWHKLCGAVTATFQLTDEHGNQVDRDAQVGDHFKIDIPGPGSKTGEGYDWVQIESIDDKDGDDENEITAIRVRPASNPTNEKEDVAHFFSDEATSSFIVERSGKKVSAAVRGRNEKPNTNANAAIDKTRNTMIAVGAMLGFSEAQWKQLVKGILDK